VLLAPALVTFVVVSWKLSTPSYWRDEAATLDAEARSIPALLRMLTNVDAVHGVYYLLMWPLVHTFGTSEIALRLPSAVAMAAAAGGVAALGRRLHSARAGLLAGLVFAVLPQVSRYGQEGRSYALVLACAVLASYLLIRAVAEPDRRWLVGYGGAIVALGLLNLFGLLLLAAHAIFLVACHRALLRRWLITAAVAGLPAVPVAVLAWRQRDQLAWLTAPDTDAPGDLTVWLAGSTGAVVLVSVLIGFGLRARPSLRISVVPASPWTGAASAGSRIGPVSAGSWTSRALVRLRIAAALLRPRTSAPPAWLAQSRNAQSWNARTWNAQARNAQTRNVRSGNALPWLALPWLVAPPVLLLAAAELAIPVYTQRYVAFCLPALALPVGVGLAGITLAPRVLALLLIATLGLPTQLAQRQPDGHGDDIRAAADILTAHEHPGDGVLYHCWSCHFPDTPREFAFAYPAAFAPLDDLALARSPSASNTLRGTEIDQPTLARRVADANRVWLIETGGSNEPPTVAESGMHQSAVYRAGDITVTLYER
jgi:mannosyltransferase